MLRLDDDALDACWSRAGPRHRCMPVCKRLWSVRPRFEECRASQLAAGDFVRLASGRMFEVVAVTHVQSGKRGTPNTHVEHRAGRLCLGTYDTTVSKMS